MIETMNKQVTLESIASGQHEPSIGGVRATAADLPSQLLSSQQSILAIKIVCRLIKMVQRHRAASIAVINGEDDFLALTETLSDQIVTLFQVLQTSSQNYNAVSAEQLGYAQADWTAIAGGWQKDSVISNYEFHCHLVDILIQLTRYTLSMRVLPKGASSEPFTADIELALFDVLKHIELMGKLRGLATHAASSKRCDNDTQIRISFLIKQVGNEYQRLYPALRSLTGPLAEMPTLKGLPKLKGKIEHLLDIIQRRILDAPRIRTNGTRIYALSTEAIDLCWETVEQALQVVENQMLDQYLQQ